MFFLCVFLCFAVKGTAVTRAISTGAAATGATSTGAASTGAAATGAAVTGAAGTFLQQYIYCEIRRDVNISVEVGF